MAAPISEGVSRQRAECPIIKVVRQMHDACDNPNGGLLQVHPDMRALLVGIRMHTECMEVTEQGDAFGEALRQYRRGLPANVAAALDAYIKVVESKE